MTSQEPLLPADTLLLEPVRRLATAATVLIAVNCAASIADAWADWNRYEVVAAYFAGDPAVGPAELDGADDVSSGVAVFLTLSYLAAAIVFLAWLSRVRHNAENLDPDGHRLTRGWTVGSWFVPVVSFWYPLRIVEDIWHATRPADVVAPSTAVRRWWFAWVASTPAGVVVMFVLRGELTVDKFRQAAIANTIGVLLTCLAGALVVPVISRITQWQSVPRRA